MADLKNDIDKYLKGELSPAEMHALEKKALSDPFLADALEGAGEITSMDFEADLRHLQSALNHRIAKKEAKLVSLWAWSARIAAGLAVVAAATFIIFQFTQSRQSKTDDLSLQTEKTPSPATPEVESNQPAAKTDTAPDDADEDKREESKPMQSAPRVTKPEPLKSEPVIAQTPAADQASSAALAREQEDATTIAQAEAIDEVAPIQPAAKDDKPAYSYSVKEKTIDIAPANAEKKTSAMEGYVYGNRRSAGDVNALPDSTVALSKALQGRAAGVAVTESKPVTPSKVVTGKVTDDNGEGLPGVNVVIKGSSVGTLTDATGDYQITINENDKLVFTYIGFSSQEADTKTNEVNVELNVDAAQLSEVVVTGYEPIDKDEEAGEHLELATPEGGKRAFKQYLEKNLVYPQLAIENKVEGRVTIQFTVESTGLLSDFSVLKGIGSGCDEEVIRLVKQGPRWIPTKRANEAVRDRVKVRMKFVLPKR